MEDEIKSSDQSKRHWLAESGPFYALLVALQFLTRLPIPKNLNPTKEEFGRCAPWFPAVGLIVGAILAIAAFILLALPLAPGIAAILILILGVLSTGAFHEDGLADTVDGVGGGWKKDDVLRIMRDSRIGAYGALAVIFLILIRAALLWGIEPAYWPHALVMAHLLSRWSILLPMKTIPYARADSPGLGKPIVESISWKGLALSTAGVMIVCFAIQGFLGIFSLALVIVIPFLAGRYFIKRIGGITGDCLGAINVLCEVAVLMIFAFAHGATISPWMAP